MDSYLTLPIDLIWHDKLNSEGYFLLELKKQLF